MKLTRKITLLLLGGALISVIAVAYFSYIFIESVLTEAVGENHLQTTRQTMDEIDRILYERKNDIESISEDEEFEGFLSGKNGPEDQVESIAKLNELSFLTGPWDILTLVDTEGIITASINQSEVGKNIAEYPESTKAFKAALEGSLYHSDLVLSRRSGKPTIIFASPVRDEEAVGQPIVGVAIGHFSWAVIEDLLAAVHDSYLFNKEGVLIGSQASDFPILKQSYSVKEQVARPLKGESGFGVLQDLSDREEVLVSYVSQEGYLNYVGNNWSLILEIPTSVALAPAKESAVRLSIVAGTVTLLSYLLILHLVISGVIRPIVTLSSIVQRIRGGDFSAKAPRVGNDEIGELALSFNIMTEGLVLAKQTAEVKEEELQVKVGELEQSKAATLNLLDDLNKEKEALAQARAKDEAILNGIGDAVFAIDIHENIILFNRVAVELSGVPEAEALGRPYKDVLHFAKEEKPDELVDSFIQDALRGQVSEMANHTVLIKKDGTPIPVADSAAPIRDSRNAVQGVVVVFRDVSAERALDQQKSLFLSTTSHQLRTPLGSMRWNLEYVFSSDLSKLPKDVQDRLKVIYDGNLRMIGLVRDLLNVARIEAGKMSNDAKLSDLKSLLELAFEEMTAEAAHKGIALKKEFGDLPSAILDPQRFREAVQNLLSNAVKYTSNGGIVTLRAGLKGSEVVVEIEDTGAGIPKADEAKMFSKFFRAENALRLDPDGNGLGLYIVKSYVEEWGGVIAFKSKEGVGTTFTVTVPITDHPAVLN